MSMNVYISAERQVAFKKKNGKRGTDKQIEVFTALQTPTRVTYEIVNSADPVQAYVDWVLRECSFDEEFKVYAEDDIFGEGEPVSVEIYNSGKEHVELFREWVERVEEDGFKVVFEVI